MSGSRNKQVIKAIIAIIIGGIYLLNPTAGFIEFLPDALPIVGNIDEAGATMLLLYGINELRNKSSNIIIAEDIRTR